MAYFKIFFVCILLASILSVNSEFIMENLIGGEPAPAQHYKYHVGIIGKYNNSYARSIVGNGGIISDIFILASADSFFNSTGDLIKLRFYAILGSLNLKDGICNEKDVSYIYTYTQNPISSIHLLAILQLSESINLVANAHFYKKLDLPSSPVLYYTSYFNTQVRIAGYGIQSMSENEFRKSKTRIRVSQNSNIILMTANLSIVEDWHCKFSLPPMHPDRDLCAMMKRRQVFEQRGLCKYDEGAPLVDGDDIVIGISNKHRPDCDNTVHGQKFSKVAYYLDFINGVMQGDYLFETTIHINREYIPPHKHKGKGSPHVKGRRVLCSYFRKLRDFKIYKRKKAQ